ncbi:Cyclohexadienyl dehydratase [Aquicella siphonis]|uniref:Cyclohexadienyl dehydratase n=1 Tax=Aquicella siphonis TaxID=254247 RepID=A0A5E4PI75_9COXI|nr:cation:dicarboxylase symporter family transporter [Aquicella siphonis]VVC76265.1 Cyclohexadienyl dehydratase [Aquicella siphonis]
MNRDKGRPPRLSLPAQVTLGLVLGIIFGLLVGDKAAVLAPVGRVYTMLMEAVVFPYLICTLLTSLGDLTPSLSARLLRKSSIIYLFLILLVFATLIILAQSLPVNLASAAHENVKQASLLQFLVPENVFYDLSQGYVPAIVIFFTLFGLALQHIPEKTSFFKILTIINQTCLFFWKKLVQLAPYATFALLADVSGTIRFGQLSDLSQFLTLLLIGSLLLIFWIIPLTISTFTDIEYTTIMTQLRDAMIISAVTTLSVVAIPYIQAVTSRLLALKSQQTSMRNSGEFDAHERDDILQTITVVSYPFTQLGNFFIYLFILFAALYYNHTLETDQYYFLPILTFFSSIGSPTSSINGVSFLSDSLSLPADTNSLYVTLIPVIRYPQVVLSVMGFSFISLIVSFSLFGMLKLNFKRLILHYTAFFLVISISSLILKNVFPNPGEKNYERLNGFSISPSLTQNIHAAIMPSFDESRIKPVNSQEDSLYRIQRSGILRVGFNADMRPFSFYNTKHELVGYDISFAYALAKSLGCNIEFIPFTWQHLVDDLLADKFDIAMSAIYVTEERLRKVYFTEPYFHSPMSMIVPIDMQNKYTSTEQIREIKSLKIGIFNDPVLIPLVQENFPNASMIILPALSGNQPAEAFLRHEIDAALWSEAQTRVWVLGHPNYASIVPSGVVAPFLMAYMIQKNSPQFLRFLNYWLELKSNDGFQQKMYNQWILIRPLENEQPRWSFLGNYL